MKIKKMKISRIGNSYHVIIPKGFIEKSDALSLNKLYDVVFLADGDRGKSGYTLNPKTSENVRNITAYT